MKQTDKETNKLTPNSLFWNGVTRAKGSMDTFPDLQLDPVPQVKIKADIMVALCFYLQL